jgi:copper transport protein
LPRGRSPTTLVHSDGPPWASPPTSHHAAAAAWIAGLAIVGWLVLPRAAADVRSAVVRRFSRVAAICVAVLVGTGAAQSIRLVGNPMNVFDTTHGRLLVVKLAAVGGMIALANANRSRVAKLIGDSPPGNHSVLALRRAMVVEFAVGVVVVGITAAMVVSPPAIGSAAGASLTDRTVVYYIL